MTDQASGQGTDRAPPVPGVGPDPRPRYQQIRQFLEHDIILGNVLLGDQLPSVQELCQAFDTSRITIDRALADLERDGYITRQRGRPATVVRNSPLPDPSTLGRFQLPGEVDSDRVRWQLFNLQYMPPGREISAKLGVEPERLVWLVERVGSTGGAIVASSSHYLKLPAQEHIVPDDIDPEKTVLAIFQAKGIPTSHTELVVTTIAAGPDEAPLLGVQPGEPLLVLDGLTYAQEGDPFPVAVLRQLHVGRYASLSVCVTPPPAD